MPTSFWRLARHSLIPSTGSLLTTASPTPYGERGMAVEALGPLTESPTGAHVDGGAHRPRAFRSDRAGITGAPHPPRRTPGGRCLPRPLVTSVPPRTAGLARWIPADPELAVDLAEQPARVELAV